MRKHQVVLASGCIAMLFSACGTYPYNPYIERSPRYGYGSTQSPPPPPPPNNAGRTEYLNDYRQPRRAPHQYEQDRRIQEQARQNAPYQSQPSRVQNQPSRVQPQPQPEPQPQPTPPVTTSSGNLPYGIPVPGKSGMVLSPYAKDSGYVDVTDIPSGTEVRDPYTRKIFLVP